MDKKQVVGRPAARRRMIVRAFRGKIVSGQLAPGSQLPPRVEIERQFEASPVTVQGALDQLKREGFVETRGRLGTFVAARPPHLVNYPIVFPSSPGDRDWGRYWASLANEATIVSRAGERNLPLYYGVNGHEDSEDYQRLLREVKAQRVAGLIFASHPFALMHTPLMSDPAIARVAVMTPSPNMTIPAVAHDRPSFFSRALDYLAERGKRRVAVISNPQPEQEHEWLLGEIERRGLKTRPYWWQGVHLSAPHFARNCAHLLFHAGQNKRPDALIITDDNLVEFATAGLIAASVSVPNDLEVVAHCNFPWPTPSVVPVKRLGYEVPKVLQACLDSIDLQRRDAIPPAVTTIAAVFEDEIAARATSYTASTP